MPAYRKTARLSEVDAAYIAGLIDGEGTITLSRKHSGENRQLSVSISSTERNILESVLQRIGVGKITRKRTAKPQHSPSFAYAIWNRQALDLLEQITPYLTSYKRKRAQCALEHYLRLTPRNGKNTRELLRKREDFERAVLSLTSRSD
jgi:hypothetical protein